MAIKLTFLGTTCMVPTKERNATAIFLEYEEEGILFDCGEGTQRQMNIAGINRNKVRKIFISHWHGDHVAGLIGLLQTISNNENPQKISVFGPVETKERLNMMLKSVGFENDRLDLDVKEFNLKKPEIIFENEDYEVWSANLSHSVPCLGFSLVEKDVRRMNMMKAKKFGLSEGPYVGKLQKGQTVTFKGKKITPDEVSYIQKGKKLSIILDTIACENAVLLAKDANLLIAESAYTSDLEEKGLQYKHLTTKQAALIASQANVKELIITHFSQRNKTLKELEEEIKTFFKDSRAAFDLMKIKL